jgi:hypothetical protein
VRPSTCATSTAAGGGRGVTPRQPPCLPGSATKEQGSSSDTLALIALMGFLGRTSSRSLRSHVLLLPTASDPRLPDVPLDRASISLVYLPVPLKCVAQRHDAMQERRQFLLENPHGDGGVVVLNQVPHVALGGGDGHGVEHLRWSEQSEREES